MVKSDSYGCCSDKISPPVSLLPGSFLELNNPNNLNDLTVKTDVNFYVKGVGQATSSTKADGSSLLFYLGTWAPGSHDFMAIEVLRKGVQNLTHKSWCGFQIWPFTELLRTLTVSTALSQNKNYLQKKSPNSLIPCKYCARRTSSYADIAWFCVKLWVKSAQGLQLILFWWKHPNFVSW